MDSVKRSSVLLLFVLLSGCAGGKPPAPGAFRDRTIITREQLDQVAYSSAYEAVEALHSNWLRVRGVNSPNTPGMVWVIMNDQRLGGVETLRNISPQEITYIRFYDAASAGARWGRDLSNGVIFVSTQRR